MFFPLRGSPKLPLSIVVDFCYKEKMIAHVAQGLIDLVAGSGSAWRCYQETQIPMLLNEHKKMILVTLDLRHAAPPFQTRDSLLRRATLDPSFHGPPLCGQPIAVNALSSARRRET